MRKKATFVVEYEVEPDEEYQDPFFGFLLRLVMTLRGVKSVEATGPEGGRVLWRE